MKRLFITFIVASVATFINAQDIIVMKTGDLVKSKVQEVTSEEIKYKKHSNPDGPLYTVKKSEVFSITYENGEKEVIEVSQSGGKQEPVVEENSNEPKLIEKAPAPNNAELIEKYHPEIKFTLKPSKSMAKNVLPIIAVTRSSVLSNEDVEITIVPKWVKKGDNLYWSELMHYIRIENKTNKTLYVDKANSFKKKCDGTSQSFFSAKQYNVSQGSSGGVGVNLGGITGSLVGGVTVGGGSSKVFSETHTEQQILAISPHSSAYLSEYKYVQVKKYETKVVSEVEIWDVSDAGLSRDIVKKGEYNLYSETESPYHNEYYITYSNVPNFSTYSTITFGIYAKYLIGIGYLFNSMAMPRSAEAREALNIREYQDFIPDFWTNKGIIVGGCTVLKKK